MRVHLYSIMYNEAKLLPYWLRHYSPWVEKMIVYVDKASNDGTLELLKANPKVEARTWPHDTGLDDEQFIQTCNYWPNLEGVKNGVDFVGFVDCDELLYHPKPLEALQSQSTDIFRAKGYALISQFGIPKDDGRQIYEQVRTGIEQENHSKFLLWRPGFRICHHHGRHEFPEYGGRMDSRFVFKNFHLHHLAGSSATRERNQRNYQRANDKAFAWNYSDESEQKGIGGTERWISEAIVNNRLFDVMEAKL